MIEKAVQSVPVEMAMKMERTECSETLAFELHTPGNNPKENIRHLNQGESLKSRSL
jgi:hypothetical protein